MLPPFLAATVIIGNGIQFVHRDPPYHDWAARREESVRTPHREPASDPHGARPRALLRPPGAAGSLGAATGDRDCRTAVRPARPVRQSLSDDGSVGPSQPLPLVRRRGRGPSLGASTARGRWLSVFVRSFGSCHSEVQFSAEPAVWRTEFRASVRSDHSLPRQWASSDRPTAVPRSATGGPARRPGPLRVGAGRRPGLTVRSAARRAARPTGGHRVGP